VAEILKQHVTLEVEGIDRMYLNVYVPRLQIVEGLLGVYHRPESNNPIWATGSNRAKIYGSVLCAMAPPGISASNG
jgi:hypothetical protein